MADQQSIYSTVILPLLLRKAKNPVFHLVNRLSKVRALQDDFCKRQAVSHQGLILYYANMKNAEILKEG
jgi:phosphopantetheine adenylyltransferase